MSANQAVRILSAKTKAKSKGTSIQGKDAEEIVAGVQAMYEKIPAFIRPMLPALPDILRRIPASAGKYTLNEIIELLDSAYETGKLKR
jgi:mevalonate kinase